MNMSVNTISIQTCTDVLCMLYGGETGDRWNLICGIENGVCKKVLKTFRRRKLYQGFTVTGTNLCDGRPLEVNGKGIRGVGGAADMEAYTARRINFISHWQCRVVLCLISCVGNVAFRSARVWFSFYPKGSDISKAHGLALAAVMLVYCAWLCFRTVYTCFKNWRCCCSRC
jgi:hypothetical protein